MMNNLIRFMTLIFTLSLLAIAACKKDKKSAQIINTVNTISYLSFKYDTTSFIGYTDSTSYKYVVSNPASYTQLISKNSHHAAFYMSFEGHDTGVYHYPYCNMTLSIDTGIAPKPKFQSNNLTVHITKYDPAYNKISGTFDGVCLNFYSIYDSIIIHDGKFYNVPVLN